MGLFKPVSDSEGNGEQVPQGLWLVELVDIKEHIQEQDTPFASAGDVQAKWEFKLLQPVSVPRVRPTEEEPEPKQPKEWVGYVLHDFSNVTMGPRSKARAWAQAILGYELEAGADFDPRLVLGQRAYATVGRSQGGRHKVMSLSSYDADAADADAAPVAAGAGRSAPF